MAISLVANGVDSGVSARSHRRWRPAAPDLRGAADRAQGPAASDRGRPALDRGRGRRDARAGWHGRCAEASKRRRAAAGIADHVHFSGYVPREAIAARYADAHVFVLPSYNEGMSVATLEALAAGLPVVVTRTGGTASWWPKSGTSSRSIGPMSMP